MNRGDIKTLFIYNPKSSTIPSILHKKRWAITICKSSSRLINYLEQLKRKDACILIHLPIDEDVLKLIKDIRQISLLPNIIIMEKRTFYEKAKNFIKEGACYYIGGTISKNKFNQKLWYARENLLYSKKWLETFYEDNVWSRNSMQALNHLIGAKLQTQLIQRLTHLRQHLDRPIFPIDYMALNESRDHISFEDTKKIIINSIAPLKKQIKKAALISNLSKENLDCFLKKSECYHLFDAISVPECDLEETIKTFQQAIVLYSVKKDKKINEKWALSYSQSRFIAISKEENISLLLDSIRGGFINICQKNNPETLKAMVFEAWQSMTWPYFHNKINLSELSYSQRLYFLDYLLRKRKKEKIIYALDILSLFPNYDAVFSKESTHSKSERLNFSYA